MAGTVIVAARAALITALRALTDPGEDLAWVNVTYSYVAKYADLGSREYIYGGNSSTANVEPSAMKGSGRIKREESSTWTLHVRVTKPGLETTQDADTRAVAIGAVVENYLAANPTLSVAGLNFARVDGWEPISYLTKSNGVISV